MSYIAFTLKNPSLRSVLYVFSISLLIFVLVISIISVAPISTRSASALEIPTLKYARPNGWQTYAIKTVQGATTASQLEVIDGGGKSIRVVFPDRTVPPVRIQNFSNLVIIGGSIKALPVSKIGGSDQRLLHMPDAKGIVHIEGMLLDGAVTNAETDGIMINGQTASVRLQNTRIDGLRGQKNSNHADGFQTFSGVKEMLFDRNTISSNYQGIKFELTNTFVMQRAVFSNINIVGLTSEQTDGAPASSGGYYFWFDPDGLFPIKLENFWIKPRGTRPLGQSAWPGVTNQVNPAVFSNNQLRWPTAAKVTGSVSNGLPSSGDFVPAEYVGLNYPAV